MQENNISTSVTVAAPPDLVWQILTAFDQYPDWHPTMEVLAGQAVAGAALRMRVAAGTPAERTAEGIVIEAGAGRLLCWEGGVPGLLWGHHRFELAATEAGTHLVNSESFTGSMAAEVMAGSREALTAEFDEANQALKTYAEKISSRR